MKRVNSSNKTSGHSKFNYHSLVAGLLIAGGVFQLALPTLAQTAAGTTISNTATATYEDPNAPGTSLSATSNRVVVTIAEVAGITVTPLATTDVNGGVVLPNDVINYDYRITNVGNDPTQFFIPGVATVSGPGSTGTLKISTDGGTSFADIVIDPVTNGFTTGAIPIGGSVIVRVPVTVSPLASSGAPISVVLGNTGANDNSAGTQNQPDATDGANANEVRTVDIVGETGGTVGGPANGESEASGFQQVLVGAQPLAFAAVLKTLTNYTTSGTPTLNDDVITYGLGLRVDATAPTGSTGLAPADLVGTTINVNTTSVTRVLVSDAIPTGTVLTGTVNVPTGWTTVYTNSPLATVANNANWVTDPTTIGGIANATRIGFINNGPIAAGTTVSGFSFQVLTSSVTTTTTVANVAQLFGQTRGAGTTLVYDESGDQNPSNVNDNGTPGSNTPTTGVANPATDGVDSGNNNTGSGPSGETTVFTLAAPGTILNGPNTIPGAVGPTNNNDDFTNQSALITPNTTPGSLIDPANVIFTNTINNPSTTASLTGVLLVPDDGTAAGTLPTGTTATLSYGGQTAVYTYNGTDFIFSSGSTIIIPSLAPGQSVNYTTTVNLPAGTPLSTDLVNGGFPSFPVPVYTFIDTNNNSRPDAADTTQNATINRVYTGFLRMVKEARILDASGVVVNPSEGDQGFTTTPNPVNIRPGNQIEYRITYTNISSAPAGAGNRVLAATNVVIKEDGTATPNNWALDQDANGVIDTSNVQGTARASNGTITYSPSGDQSGTTAATDVTQYLNTLGVIVDPQASGTFIIRRRIN